MNISEKMKSRRLELNLAVKDVAKEIGVSVSTYREWEHGRKILGEPYYKIAEALEMSLGELLGHGELRVKEFAESLDVLEKHVKIIKRNFTQFI